MEVSYKTTFVNDGDTIIPVSRTGVACYLRAARNNGDTIHVLNFGGYTGYDIEREGSDTIRLRLDRSKHHPSIRLA